MSEIVQPIKTETYKEWVARMPLWRTHIPLHEHEFLVKQWLLECPLAKSEENRIHA